MLVIISDLHFEEESSRNISGGGTHAPIYISRNIPPSAFRKIFTQLHEQARHDNAQRIDLVLAGDIFDLNRTAIWFRNNDSDARPYLSNRAIQPGSPVEAKVLEILQAINNPDQGVHTILQNIRDLARKGTYTNMEFRQQSFSRAYVDEAGQAKEAEIPVQIHYIPGNHDRLANATPAIRQKVRELLGVEGGDAPFPQILLFPAERALIRHGHEYDHYNFATDLSKIDPIPLHLPPENYDDPPFGDFVTVDLVSRISESFRALYSDETILSDPLLRQLYERALAFDDLRPLRAIFNYLLHIPQDEQLAGHSYDPGTLWRERVRPVIKQLRDDIYAQNRQYGWLQKLSHGRGFDPVVLVVRLALWLPVWNVIPYWLVQWLSNRALKSYKQEESKATYASREETVLRGDHLLVIAGHTHRPTVELIGRAAEGEQYYVDTGTWRHRSPSSPNLKTFGRIKTLTYAVVYGPDEDLGEMAAGHKLISLDHWSGFSKRWPQPEK
jgi:UDP-2,3-diacylglucosamine pyrophosphatase LpxH